MQSVKVNIPTIKVGIVDDHVLLASALSEELNKFPGVKNILLASHGKDLLHQLKKIEEFPDILLMDVSMDEMNGIEATKWVSELYPEIKVVAFTSMDDELTILQMINAGACAYLKKNINKAQMEAALNEIHKNGKYRADLYHLYAKDLEKYKKRLKNISFVEPEIHFLKLLCEGYSYKQMADIMNVAVRTIHYYKASLSDKLQTNSVVVMVLQAVRMGVISINSEKKFNH